MEKKPQNTGRIIFWFFVTFILCGFIVAGIAHEFSSTWEKKREAEQKRKADLDAIANDWQGLKEYKQNLDRILLNIRTGKEDLKKAKPGSPKVADIAWLLCDMRNQYNIHAGNYNARMFQAYEDFPNLDDLLDVVKENPLPRKFELILECPKSEEEK